MAFTVVPRESPATAERIAARATRRDEEHAAAEVVGPRKTVGHLLHGVAVLAQRDLTTQVVGAQRASVVVPDRCVPIPTVEPTGDVRLIGGRYRKGPQPDGQ